ncbi:MAG TPA: hypothetical protein VIH37_04475 [Candidatus Limnocylindrales bacterium]
MTTDRVLREATPSALAKAAKLAKPRGAAVMTVPARASVLIGVSAAVYAVTLSSVAGLQAQAQAETAAQNQVGIDAVARARAANDALESVVKTADARARALVAEYNGVGQDMSAYQAQLASLSALVAKVQGSAAALNTKIQLPTVSMHGAVGGGGGVVTTTTASGKPVP